MKNSENPIMDLSLDFSIDTIDFTELLESKRKFVVANQLLKSATSIGANVREAQNAESKADFIRKMKIAAKEADESKYWFEICNRAKTYPNPDVNLSNQLDVITKIISKIIGTSKRNLK